MSRRKDGLGYSKKRTLELSGWPSPVWKQRKPRVPREKKLRSLIKKMPAAKPGAERAKQGASFGGKSKHLEVGGAKGGEI